MAGITQQIPNYIFGMSEQPDELKVPGQVKDLVNGLPDVTRGLAKRPGSALVASMFPTFTSGSHWFNIERDENEQYIGAVHPNGEVQVWDAQSGIEKNVFPNSLPYLGNSNPEDIQVLTVQDTTYITNRRVIVGMDGPAPIADFHYAFISLKQVKPGTQYSLDVANNPNNGIPLKPYWRATNIKLSDKPYDNTNEDYPGNGNCRWAGRQLFGDDSANIPDIDPRNFWFEIDSRCAGSLNEEGDPFDVYTSTATLKFGGENTPVGYVKTVTMENSKEAREWSVEVTEAILVEPDVDRGLIRPEPTPFEGLGATADTILAGVKRELEAKAGVDVQVIGSGLYIISNAPITITTPDSSLFTIIQESANDISELPSSCKDGYVIKISNSGEEADDYYLKFVGDGGQDGPGVWEETHKPAIYGDPDPPLLFDLVSDTMPVVLTRQASGNFTLETIDWESRLVGDDVTNPKPSFVDSTINKMVFYKNRLGMLSGEYIILSRAGDYYNFFVKTATTVTSIDPIDIACSSQSPAILYEAIEVNAGLVLFSENQQFLLTTNSDVFGPRTAKINALSTYKFNITTNPVSLGTSIAFLSDGNDKTRLFEMVGVNDSTEPQVLEQSKLVSKGITRNYTNIAESKENSFLALSDTSSNIVWVYKYFNSGEKRVQSAWVKWKMPGTIDYHCIMSDVYYTVVQNNGSFTLQAVQLNLSDVMSGVYLDSKVRLFGGVFNQPTNQTEFFLPPEFFFINPLDLLVVATTTSGTSPGPINYAVEEGTVAQPVVSNQSLFLDGDWTGATPILGIKFSMTVDFPTIFAQTKSGDSVRSDVRASLIIHRIKLNLDDTHTYKTILLRRGKQPYVYTHETTLSDAYKANNQPFLLNDDETVSVYERNTNVNLRLEADFPKSCTLISLNWEGDYNPKYYKSV